MVQKLLQVRAHLILCFRAEEKIEMVRGDDGKMKIVPKKSATGLDGWMPISEKNLPYELTASFLLLATQPGIPHPIKLQEQHRALFPLDKPITEQSGKLIAQWASGAKPAPSTSAVTASPDPSAPPRAPAGTVAVAGALTDDAIVETIDDLIGKRKFKSAHDLAGMIADEGRRADALTRVQAAYEGET